MIKCEFWTQIRTNTIDFRFLNKDRTVIQSRIHMTVYQNIKKGDQSYLLKFSPPEAYKLTLINIA